MPPNLQALINMTLADLSEAQDSVVAQYDDGQGNIIQTTAQSITQFLNDGQSLIARSCLYYPGAGQYNLVAGQGTVALQTLSPVVWQPLDVTWDGVQLRREQYSYASILFPNRRIDPLGIPKYWWPEGNDSIGIHPKPQITQQITVYGPALPPPLINLTDAPTWMMDDEALYISHYAKYRTAIRNTEDPTLADKIGVWQKEMIDAFNRMRARMAMQSPDIFERFYAGAQQPSMPIPAPQQNQQQQQ